MRLRAWSALFTSPHPAMFTDDVIDAGWRRPRTSCRCCNMPLQSGSDKGAQGHAPLLPFQEVPEHSGQGAREHPRNAVITTDIIVALPGETEEDFRTPWKVVEQACFSLRVHLPVLDSPRHPGGDHENQIPKEVVQERYERLIALQDCIAGEENRKQLGETVELMVVAEAGRKADQTHRFSGRGPISARAFRCPRVARLRVPATWSPCPLPRLVPST